VFNYYEAEKGSETKKYTLEYKTEVHLQVSKIYGPISSLLPAGSIARITSSVERENLW
jgi:hypothetical protein